MLLVYEQNVRFNKYKNSIQNNNLYIPSTPPTYTLTAKRQCQSILLISDADNVIDKTSINLLVSYNQTNNNIKLSMSVCMCSYAA